MKGLDVFVVRFLPFILYVQMLIILVRAWMGLNDYPFNLLHSNSAIFSLSLFIISLSNKKYHCIYNRAMYIFLIFIPTFNYLDAKYLFFEDVDAYLWFVSGVFVATAFITAYLAIRHFVQITKRKIINGRK